MENTIGKHLRKSVFTSSRRHTPYELQDLLDLISYIFDSNSDLKRLSITASEMAIIQGPKSDTLLARGAP